MDHFPVVKLAKCEVHKMRKSPIQNEKKRENHFPMAESEQISYHVREAVKNVLADFAR